MAERKWRVVCTDDDSVWLRVLSRIFRSWLGADVREFESRELAVTSAIHEPPDLFTTDLYGPDISGFEAIQRLRENTATSRLRIWVISGQLGNMHEAFLAASEAGATEFFPKPMRQELLLQAVQQLFRQGGGGPERIDPVDLGKEQPELDYKGAVDLTSDKARAELARDVIAMANYGGGYIVFGREQLPNGTFGYRGLTDDEISMLEVTKLNNAVKKYIEYGVFLSPSIVTRQGKRFAVIQVPSMSSTPLMAKRDHQEAKLFTGRLYTRTAAVESAPVTTSAELSDIIERAIRMRTVYRAIADAKLPKPDDEIDE